MQGMEIAIAGLLHDVGKILQRARTDITEQTRRLQNHLCPSRPDGRPTHLHVLWSSDFLERFCEYLPAGLDSSPIKRVAGEHHRPSGADGMLLAEADRLASGHDRRPDEAEAERVNFRQVGLQSVFPRLRLRSAEQSAPTRPLWKPAPLTIGEALLPSQALSGDEVAGAWPILAADLDRWLTGADQLSSLPPELFVRALIGFSERFQGLVPASAMDRPDVSLHDHALVTAAIAAAMHAYHESQGEISEDNVRDREVAKYRFVAGNLRGIQDFIFTLGEQRKRIAKTYRAKSFYVAAVTEAVVHRLLSATGLPPTNCVLNAGGRFVILADSSASTREALAQADRELQRWFMDQFLGVLGLNLDYDLTISGAEMLDGRFEGVYRRIELATERAKGRQGASWLQEGRGWSDGSFRHAERDPRQLEERVAEQMAHLGQALPEARWLGLYAPQSRPGGLLGQPLDCAGLMLQVGTDADGIDMPDAAILHWVDTSTPPVTWLPHRPLANYIHKLDAADMQQLDRDSDARDGRGAEADETEPATEGATATFEHLALLSRRPAGDGGRLGGVPMLACLKADMDRLGQLFAEALGGDVSFARIASMSRLLDLFFKGYLTHRLSEEQSPWRHTYTVFAGGDDLMLIGAWPAILDLAAELRHWVDTLAGGNEQVSISAGIAMTAPHTPPSHMNRAAEEQLEQAKSSGRNRIAVLKRYMAWPEYEAGLKAGRTLDGMLRGDGEGLQLNRSFVYRLHQHARSAERVRRRTREGKPVALADLTWRSHLLYDIHRNVERRLGRDATDLQRRQLQWLQELLPVEARPTAVASVILATTYALYLNRGA